MVSTSGAVEQPNPDQSRIPLCVDMDGTLLRTDVLLEGMLRLLRRNPGFVFLLMIWAFRGRPALKSEVAKRVDLPVETLPVNAAFLGWLQSEKARGRRLVLCTAAWHSIARAVASRFRIFDEVLATEDDENLSGRHKANRLVAKFGEQGYDYAGNGLRDLPVWQHARSAIVVQPSLGLTRTIGRVPNVERTFRASSRRLTSWVRAFRLHQWTKNVLVLVPALAAHRILEPSTLVQVGVAFFSFSLAASGNYLLNDLLDLDADRAHATKHRRPFASGDLQIHEGVLLSTLLMVTGTILGGLVLGPVFLTVLLAYLLVSFWYSLALKRHAMVDIMCLAALYTLRIIAGSAATEIEPTFWLLAFSMFLFLSLAAAKRVTELRALVAKGRSTTAGRGYEVDDLPLLLTFGVAAGYVSVLVMALYVQSGAEALYAEPRLLWLICPVLLYWISRIWLKTYRGQLDEDPVVFALTDRPSLLAATVCAILIALAT